MLIWTWPKALHQIFYEVMHDYKLIFKNTIGPDNTKHIFSHEWVNNKHQPPTTWRRVPIPQAWTNTTHTSLLTSLIQNVAETSSEILAFS